MIYQAYRTPGTHPRNVRMMLIRNSTVHPVRTRTGNGGRKRAMSARHAPLYRCLVVMKKNKQRQEYLQRRP